MTVSATLACRVTAVRSLRHLTPHVGLAGTELTQVKRKSATCASSGIHRRVAATPQTAATLAALLGTPSTSHGRSSTSMRCPATSKCLRARTGTRRTRSITSGATPTSTPTAFTRAPCSQCLSTHTTQCFTSWPCHSSCSRAWFRDSFGGACLLRSRYIFNQIVPQLSLGSGLASSDPVTFKPKFITQKNWMIQAQYFWMHSNGSDYALCGTLINVTAGDVIETRIAFEPGSGSMVASIGVKGGTPDQLSQITSPRPFPNEHPPLWNTWGDFFQAAEKLSQATQGKGVLNHADFNIETHGVPPDVLCDICPFALTKTAAPNQLGGQLDWVNWYPTRDMSDDGVPVGCTKGCLPTP
jgi:hypothetical protein